MLNKMLVVGVVAVGSLLVGAKGDDTARAQDKTAGQEQRVGEACGGFAGTKCPKGLTCVDDPTDSCDPSNGGRDCIGICVP